MTTKLVCRLLSGEGRLLGWSEHQAQILGDGCLRASSNMSILVEKHGKATEVSIHWVDINVEARIPFAFPIPVESGGALTCFERGDVMVTIGPAATGLPPVTVKSTAVGIPAGHLGAVGRA